MLIREFQLKDQEQVNQVFNEAFLSLVPALRRVVVVSRFVRIFVLGSLGLAISYPRYSWYLLGLAALMFLLCYVAPSLMMRQYVNSFAKKPIADNYQAEKGHKFWVMEHDGKVVGTLGAQHEVMANAVTVKSDIKRPVENRLFARRMAVANCMRRQGVARKLLDTMLQYARQNKYHSIYLETSQMQQPAVQLYESVGFKKVRTQQWPKYGIPILVTYQYELVL
eukprot:TRINITY_DN745_c0_g2_i1.p1 TRINITY_DN745_c0_g2~~TRINITY_DN745_c0_g2_i1.p1  ORF type:complete len:223 (-),score=28.81 TRINITY_DN745_c0_g2_i1:109-777(-)